MLWNIKIKPVPLKPGQIIKITEKKIFINQIKKQENQRPTPSTIEKLHEIMTKTTLEYANKIPRATVAFSGGIDSLLTVYYLQQNNAQLELIWTGIEEQPEQIIAQEVADQLGLRLHIDTYILEQVEKIIDTIITSIEEPDPVKTGIAYPFHWVSKKTYEMGYRTTYSGNGADELFAGYMRYLDKYLRGEDPNQDIYHDVINSYLQNFNRDTKTCLDQNIRLLLPFTHPRLVDYALGIPLNQKLPDNRKEPRKKILRELAKKQGIPVKFADRPKKAAQYSSGVNRALSKIAKKQSISLRELISKRFQKIESEFSRE
jgi:asparagine synthase (glutamine-hydrolysing)